MRGTALAAEFEVAAVVSLADVLPLTLGAGGGGLVGDRGEAVDGGATVGVGGGEVG